MRIKLVIFDLDGTLLNTLDDLAGAVNQALESRGLSARPVDSYKLFVGNGAKNMVKRAAGPGADEAEVEEILREYKGIYAENWNRLTMKYTGIDGVLDWLDANTVQYAVLSNKPHEFTARMVGYYFPGRSFLAVLGQKNQEPLKPDPENALKIIAASRCDLREAAFVGDSSVDMDTAVNAGIYPIGALWGFRDKDELLRHGAKSIAETPAELIKILPGI